MYRVILMFCVIIIDFSCFVSKEIHYDKISVNEANRVIKEVIDKFGVERYHEGVIFFIDEPINFVDSIIYSKNKNIKKLSDFKLLQKLPETKFISREDAMKNDSIRLYYGISFHKLNDNMFSVHIGSTFKGSIEKPRLEDGSVFAIFKYKIDKGKAKLVRYRF